jgi:hypothetical protein
MFFMAILLSLRVSCLLPGVLPDLFAIHGQLLRSGDAQPDSISFDCQDRDGQVQVGRYDALAALATEY